MGIKTVKQHKAAARKSSHEERNYLSRKRCLSGEIFLTDNELQK
jgi:hypothetical protein